MTSSSKIAVGHERMRRLELNNEPGYPSKWFVLKKVVFLILSYVQTNSDKIKISKNLKFGFFWPQRALMLSSEVSRRLVTNKRAMTYKTVKTLS